MKKIVTASLISITSLTAFAQNVGIGTNFPTAKLNVDSGDIKVGNPVWNSVANDKSIKFGDGDFVTIGESGADDRMELQAKNFILKPSSGGAAYTGNVGIGTALAPTAKLEVNGTFKLTDGTQGANKVLTSDASGNAIWTSIGGNANYKYCRQISVVGAGSFLVPAGTTEVMVELWGAGSGGVITNNTISFVLPLYFFGGTSGGYASTTQTVVPGSALNYTIGAGSSDNAYNINIADGGSTSMTFPAGNIVAFGGKGHLASALSAGEPQSGTSTLPNFITLFGNPGGFPTFKTEQTSATDFWRIRSAGDGGRPVGIFNSYVQRGAVYYFLNNAYQYDHSESSNINNYPSSGGGSDEDGNGGGNGRILIWYN